jgi:hypothetical protein
MSSKVNYQNSKENIWAAILLALILLLGNYGVFTNKHFITDEDVVLNTEHNFSNSQSSGWRPDAGLGMSYMYGDPGAQHTWSLSRWWKGFFPGKTSGLTVKVILFLWVASFTLYLFLRKILDQLNWFTTLVLAALIPFSPLRYEFLFPYSNIIQIIATPLLALVLYEFIQRPKIHHYFYFTLIIFALTLLGSSVSLFQLLVFEVIFCICLAIYLQLHTNLKVFFQTVVRVFILNLVSGVTLCLLGAWIFYAVAYEQSILGYVRDPEYSAATFFKSTSLHELFLHFFTYLHSGLFSHSSAVLGIDQKLGGHSWNNVSPIFPVIFLVTLFWKSKTFWEYAAKFVILASYLFHEILYWIPGLFTLVQQLYIVYPLGKLHPSIQVFQIVLIGFVIQRFKTEVGAFEVSKKKFFQIVALFLSALYAGLFALTAASMFFPQTLIKSFSNILAQVIPKGSSTELFYKTLIESNIDLFGETMRWPSIFFYGSTTIFLLLFATKSWLVFVPMHKGRVFALALLLNAFFLSSAVYPLGKGPLIWEQQKLKGSLFENKFLPTDRLARVGLAPCSGKPGYQNCILNKFFDKEFGPKRYLVGYRWMTPLEFTKTKSFSTKPQAEFIKSFMTKKNRTTPSILRDIQTEPPIFDSPVYDISAVNYILSSNLLPELKHLEMVHKSKQFYLYRNNKAWPYFYFADHIETIGTYEDLYNAKKGRAYLWQDDKTLSMPQKSENRKYLLELKKFEYGDVEFKYASDEQEFLVMADSWHPNWRASVNGENIPIFKTNGVFKGVLLPRGKGVVHFFFDNSPYLPGIWISIIAWSLFLLGWRWCAFKCRERY